MNWGTNKLTEVDKCKIWKDRAAKFEWNVSLTVGNNVLASQVDPKNILSQPVVSRSQRFLDKNTFALSVANKFLHQPEPSGAKLPAPSPGALPPLASHSSRQPHNGGDIESSLASARSTGAESYASKVSDRLERLRLDPVQKYSGPQTSNQEVGWILPTMPEKPKPRGQNHNLRKQTLTQWMEHAIQNGPMRK